MFPFVPHCLFTLWMVSLQTLLWPQTTARAVCHHLNKTITDVTKVNRGQDLWDLKCVCVCVWSSLLFCHSPRVQEWVRGWESPESVYAVWRLCGRRGPGTPSVRWVLGGWRASPIGWCLWECASSRYRPCLWSSSILEAGQGLSGMTAHSRYLVGGKKHTHIC